MRRTVLTFATGFVLAVFATGGFTEWPKLFRLSRGGVAARGMVLSYDGAPRGRTQIKVLDRVPQYVVETNCAGFSCEPGSEVRIVVLPSDERTFFVGEDLRSQFLLASLATFLITPLGAGAGFVYSSYKVSRLRGKESPWSKVQVQFFRALPVLMCAGLVVSTFSSWAQNIPIARYQAASLVFAVTGSFFYLAGHRFVHRQGLRAALTWGAFALAAVTAVLDIGSL